MTDSMKMSVSPIFRKNGKPTAFVLFTDGTRNAEGKIPDCTIISNQGFFEKEIKALELYLKMEQENILQTAKGINIMGAFLNQKR